MTIAKFLSPFRLDIVAVNVFNQTFLGLFKCNSIYDNSSPPKLLAISSNRISSLAPEAPVYMTFLFLATRPKYLSRSASSCLIKLVLFPYPPSIKTIPGLYPRSKLFLINLSPISGFL